MMDSIGRLPRRAPTGSKINRDHLQVLVFGLPWLTILLGSMTPVLPIIAPLPLVPPMGFILMLAWRLLRPGMLPLWAGLPLGAFDDLLSGQPFGSGIMLFSSAMIVLELLDLRFPWRSFLHDWMIAVLAIAIYLISAGLVSGASFGLHQLGSILPQFLLSALSFPIITRMVSLLDRLRLMRIRRIE